MSDRRSQILRATLDLLGEVPLAELGTRAIAARVGITQPGLFRHFLTRDAIVVAAIAEVREALAGVAAAALAIPGPPRVRVEALVDAIAGYASANRGMPRLLFHDAAAGSPFRPALAQVTALQRSLFAALVRDATRSGDLPAVDPDAAAKLLLAMLQGSFAQWLAEGGDPRADAALAVAAWWAALAAGIPAPAGAVPERAPIAAVSDPLVQLDVKPLLAAGQDPLGAVLGALDTLPSDGVLSLVAPFWPAPLVRLLGARGYRVDGREVDADFVLVVRAGGLGDLLDVHDLPAPEPLAAVLTAAEALPPGGALVARTPRTPRMLLDQLRSRGFGAVAVEEPDGVGLVHVRRPA